MNNILKLNVASKHELAKIYIQQFKYGGLFITGETNYKLGDEVFLIINLPDATETLAVNGRVNWLAPATSVGYPPGIGVHFNNDKAAQDAKSKIEIMLGGLLQSRAISYTF